MPPARTANAASRRQTRSTSRSAGRRRAPARRAPLRLRWERIGRVALLVVFAVVLALYVQRTLTYVSVRNQAAQQLSIVHQLKRQNQKLTQQQKALSNPQTIEQDARALGMVEPGERPFAVSGLPAN